MRKLLVILLLSSPLFGQAWSGILDPTRVIDWSGAGVPGGIPSGSWTQAGATVQTSACGANCNTAIQNALNACGTNHFVLLGTGTFNFTHFVIPPNCALRGQGDSTVLNDTGTDPAPVSFANNISGTNTPFVSGSAVSFTGGVQGATTIVVSNASGIGVGSILMLTQPDITSFMTQSGHGGNCDFCNSGYPNDGNSGQIVRVTNVAGTTITIDPPLFYAYANPSFEFRFTVTVAANSGLEFLKISQNDTHPNSNSATINMIGAYGSWVQGIHSDFADNAHMFLQYSLHCSVIDSFFHDAFQHGPGSNDQQLNLAYKSTLNLIQNNIFWRMHVGIMNQRGDAGNVIAYNYSAGHYDSTAASGMWNEPGIDSHGAHPWFNLVEGNQVGAFLWDDYWGSHSHLTLFRNWAVGENTYLLPKDQRGALTGSTIFTDNGNNFSNDVNDFNNYFNIVGNISGNAHFNSLSPAGVKISPASGFSNGVGFRIGYNGSSNSAVAQGTCSPVTVGGCAYKTAFIHGQYDLSNDTFIWDAGHPDHTLPASFYLTSKPSWFGSVPFPPIGPDVNSGGTGSLKYVNDIPAKKCFDLVTSNGTSNTGVFNPSVCYGASVTPSAQLSPSSFTFEDTHVGQTKGPTTVTLSNIGNGDMNVTAFSLASGDFSIVGGTCTTPPFVLTAGNSCTITILFTPTLSGQRGPKTLSVSDDASGSPHTMTVSGTGIFVPVTNSSFVVSQLLKENLHDSHTHAGDVVDYVSSR